MQASCWCELTLKARDRLLDRPSFDLQLEWMVGVGGGGGEKRNRNVHSPTPTPLLIFDRRPPPWYKFIPFPSRPLPLKSKMAAIMFVMKLLSTCQWFPVFLQVLQSAAYVEVQILYWRTSCDDPQVCLRMPESLYLTRGAWNTILNTCDAWLFLNFVLPSCLPMVQLSCLLPTTK